MLKPDHSPVTRPYWHVDLKWVCGIIVAVGLMAASVLHILATLTTKSVAIPVASQIAAGMVSKNGLDDATDIEEFKQKARLQPGDKVETLPGIFITKADLETLSPRQLRLKIAGLVLTPYYELGAKGVAAKQTADPKEQAHIIQQAGLLGLLNQSTHDTLQRLLWVSLGLLVLPLIGLVYFSAGFGRLVSPGIIMAVMTFPSAVLSGILQIAQHSSKPIGGNGSSTSSGPIPALSPESLVLIFQSLLPGFLVVFALGATLLLAAAIGKAVSKRRSASHPL